ncbi:amidohydrolase family protein [Rhizosaccharibacter radicis]|uniref:Amidohydrolase n=1 Tax=Rhizosaccharibacter radicis TaxID=2782605 RepID=A0ABT1W0P9_9PROT|nr:amidohydrolase [Acetobacteraceae bacterium KSS12]
MYTTADGEEFFIVDGHIHNWDASVENHRNIHGRQFIDCFYGYHQLSPPEYLWPREKFYRYGEATLYDDLFVQGYDDMAILQPTYLKEFFTRGFNTTEDQYELTKRYPERFIVNGAFDPRDEEEGLDRLRENIEKYKLKGIKLYTAEWKGESKGWRLTDRWASRYLEVARDMGVRNIHVHKGPTILPLNRDAFDVADVDDAATSFQELNFIVEHCGLPRLDDFCWIATQETNVYAGLAVVLPFIHKRPEYFAHVLGELLFWIGPDKICYGSDYAIWSPRWMVEKFVAFDLPDSVSREKNVELTREIKHKILGLNMARLYDIDIPAKKRFFAGEQLSRHAVAAE